ncbi:MAG: hypothetical protein RLZZ08_1467 [Pseudomonadota bacterium]|jgi:hypothetical protein
MQEEGEIGLNSAVSLLFAPGTRPDLRAIRALAGGAADFVISHDPQGDAADPSGSGTPDATHLWVELLAKGLTFDLSGLATGEAAAPPPCAHLYGVPSEIAASPLEAITLAPGPHLAGGGGMLPVIRTLALLAARLTALPGTIAVAWHPARCWSAPDQFRNQVLRWIDGGVFPGFCLAALAPMVDGGLQTEGLALFTGQELRIEPDAGDDRAADAKIAVRLLHQLVETGRVDAEQRFIGPAGDNLRLEPSANGRFVRVWRD